MTERPVVNPADRAARVRTSLVMGGYDPGTAKDGALVEVLADLLCLAQAQTWSWEACLDRARAIAGPPAPPRLSAPPAAPTDALRESWTACEPCQRVHPTWAACLARPLEKLIAVVDDASGRKAAHIEPWYAKLPGVLARAEREMTDLFAGGEGMR